MLLTELKKIAKEGIVIVLILAALTIYILTSGKDPYIPTIILMLSLLIYASYTGWSMFERERQEGAEEYLLSMPVSRARLFFLKFMPRLFCTLLMLGFFLLAQNYLNIPVYFAPMEFSIIYISFFLISLSLSLSVKNFIGAFFLTAFLSVGLSLLLKAVDPDIADFSVILTVNLTLLVFPIAFFIVFQTYDIKPLKSFNLKFITPMVVVIALLIGIAWLRSSTPWSHYYLTQTGDILRYSCPGQKSQLLRAGKVTAFKGCVLPLGEENGSVYMQMRKRDEICRLLRLVKLDLQTGTTHPFKEVQEGWNMGGGFLGKSGVFKDGNYYNIMKNKEEKQFKVLIVSGDTKTKIKEIPVYGNFHEESIRQLFHVADNPVQFFVHTKSRVYRVFASGEAEELFAVPEAMSVWKNRLLVFQRSGMTLYDISAQLKPIFQKKGKIRKILRKYGSRTSPRVMFREDKSYYIFGMEDQRIEPVEFKYKPYYYNFFGENFENLHLLWVRGDLMVYGRMVNGEIKKKKKWVIKLDDSHGRRKILPFPWGVVAYNSKEYERYLFDH
ncbi:MAG: ABC transporter permease [bacterium]|nr:ABC transporter permease [bacterium]